MAACTYDLEHTKPPMSASDSCDANWTFGSITLSLPLPVFPWFVLCRLQVRVRNLTYQQPFSPPLIVAHTNVSCLGCAAAAA